MVDYQNTGEDIRGHFPVTYWEAKLCLPDPNSILLLPVDGSVTTAFEFGGGITNSIVKMSLDALRLQLTIPYGPSNVTSVWYNFPPGSGLTITVFHPSTELIQPTVPATSLPHSLERND